VGSVGVGILDGGGDRRRGRAVSGVNSGRPIGRRCVVSSDTCAVFSASRFGLEPTVVSNVYSRTG